MIRFAAHRDGERGVILPSVLIVLALASTIVMVMISLQEIAIQRSRRFNEAAQANAYARGGELSIIVALRRDGRDASQTDNLTEGWAAISDENVAIENGTFSLAATDAQARFNINNLAALDLTSQNDLDAIAKSLRLPPSVAIRVSAFLKAHGAIADLGELAQAGLAQGDIATLSQMIVALPVKTRVNVNTAGEDLLGALLGNQALARQIIAQRKRKGLLTADDMSAARAVLPPGAGFTSDFYEVRTAVTVGDTRQAAAALLQRTFDDGIVKIAVIRRTHMETAPSPAPSSDQ